MKGYFIFSRASLTGASPPDGLMSVVVIPRTILSRRNRRCALSATDTWNSEEEKDARGVTCFTENKLEPPKGLIPLMAVIQQNKQKVRPVLDYRELNDHVDPFTARADISTEKLRE